MGLKLEKGLKHQTEAVDRINKVFENVPILNNTLKYANPVVNLNSSKLLTNIKGQKTIRKENARFFQRIF